MRCINLASEFSSTPGTRLREFSHYSGEEFREDILLPALLEHDVVEVDLDDCVGITNSFLEEVFGGIIRDNIEFRRVIPVAKTKPFRAEKALNFMRQAAE